MKLYLLGTLAGFGVSSFSVGILSLYGKNLPDPVMMILGGISLIIIGAAGARKRQTERDAQKRKTEKPNS